MKKILLTIIALGFVSSVCFAEQAVPQATVKVMPKAVETKTFTGKIDSVSLLDIAKGTKSEIIVVDEKSQKLTFLVKGTTTIYDAMSNAMLLGNIKKDSDVKVSYVTTKEGVNEATSIRLAK
jgi:hypothetical protein